MSTGRSSPKIWVADALTLSNGIFGFLSILTWSVELGGPLSPFDDTAVAAAYIGLGMVTDGLDGIVARAWGSTGLGNALDTMSDFLTFCVAPAVFLVNVIHVPQGTVTAAIEAVVALGFIVAGMLRLARHRDGDTKGQAPPNTFVGLPAPWSGATLVVLLVLDIPTGLALLAGIVLAGLNVSHLPYPKTRGALTKVALGIIVASLLVISGLIFFGPQATWILTAAAAVALTMIAIGPLVARMGLTEET